MAKEIRLDCLGEACPIPLIKAQKKIKDMAVGDTLIIEVDHSCAIKNIPEWARKEQYNVEVEEVADGEWDIIVEKSK